MSRIPIIFLIGFIFNSSFKGAKVIVFILYVLGSLSDLLDGYLARKNKQISDFGKLIDALNDKIYIISLFVILIGKNLIPLWGIFCIIMIICREFFITGLRSVLVKSGLVMAADKHGKLKTFSQIISIGGFFFIEMVRCDIAPSISLTTLRTLHVINNVLFVTATILTIKSGYKYISKYYTHLK